MANEWTQPGAPPGPLFVGKKERDFAKQITDEIVEKIIGQRILYYPIDIHTSNFHPLYGEAIRKSFLPPIHIHVLVQYDGSNTTSEEFGVDRLDNATVFFHRRRLTEDQDLFVREGDFVLYGDTFYEIVTLSEPKQLYGQIDHLLEISAKCVRAREDLFDGT